jgi:hypothetical protein
MVIESGKKPLLVGHGNIKEGLSAELASTTERGDAL